MKGYKAKSVKGKGTWMKPRGNYMQASKNPLVESHRMYSIIPAASYDNKCEMSGSLLEIHSPKFLLGAGYIGPLCLQHIL